MFNKRNLPDLPSREVFTDNTTILGTGAKGKPLYSVTPMVFGEPPTNYSEFESDGTLVAHGSATTWTDVDFPIIIRTIGPNIPTLTAIQGNILVPQWAEDDFSNCEGQELVHGWKEGSTIYWHVHVVTNGTDVTDRYLRWEIEWVWANPNNQLSSTIITDSGDIIIPANTPAKTHVMQQVSSYPLIGGIITGHIYARLKRIVSTGAAPTNNPWCSMLQIHLELDTNGSRDISSK